MKATSLQQRGEGRVSPPTGMRLMDVQRQQVIRPVSGGSPTHPHVRYHPKSPRAQQQHPKSPQSPKSPRHLQQQQQEQHNQQVLYISRSASPTHPLVQFKDLQPPPPSAFQEQRYASPTKRPSFDQQNRQQQSLPSRKLMMQQELPLSPRMSIMPQSDLSSQRKSMMPQAELLSRRKSIVSQAEPASAIDSMMQQADVLSPRRSMMSQAELLSQRKSMMPEAELLGRKSVILQAAQRRSSMPQAELLSQRKSTMLQAEMLSPRKSMMPQAEITSPRKSMMPQSEVYSQRKSMLQTEPLSPRKSMMPQAELPSLRNSMVPQAELFSHRKSMIPQTDLQESMLLQEESMLLQSEPLSPRKTMMPPDEPMSPRKSMFNPQPLSQQENIPAPVPYLKDSSMSISPSQMVRFDGDDPPRPINRAMTMSPTASMVRFQDDPLVQTPIMSQKSMMNRSASLAPTVTGQVLQPARLPSNANAQAGIPPRQLQTQQSMSPARLQSSLNRSMSISPTQMTTEQQHQPRLSSASLAAVQVGLDVSLEQQFCLFFNPSRGNYVIGGSGMKSIVRVISFKMGRGGGCPTRKSSAAEQIPFHSYATHVGGNTNKQDQQHIPTVPTATHIKLKTDETEH